MNKYKIGFWFAVSIAWVVAIFFVAGVYNVFWNIRDKNSQIEELTIERNAWEGRAKELDAYIIEKEKQFRVATKFDNFFMMIADPDQVIDMEALDGYIESRKQFFEPHK